jgi:hypothetical protein
MCHRRQVVAPVKHPGPKCGSRTHAAETVEDLATRYRHASHGARLTNRQTRADNRHQAKRREGVREGSSRVISNGSTLGLTTGRMRETELARLATGGAEYTDAQTSDPSDSDPGGTALMTGGDPKATTSTATACSRPVRRTAPGRPQAVT